MRLELMGSSTRAWSHATELPPRSFAIAGNSLAAVWALYVQQTWQHGAPGWDDAVQIREARGVRIYLTANADYDDHFYPHMAASSQLQALDKLVTVNAYHQLSGNSYGYRIHRLYGEDQIELLLRRWRAKPESKKLIVNMAHPQGCAFEREAGLNGMACMSSLHVFMRDDQLDMTVTMRSQDAWRSHANLWSAREWQRRLVARFNAEGGRVHRVGDLLFQINNAHLYQHHWESAQAVSTFVMRRVMGLRDGSTMQLRPRTWMIEPPAWSEPAPAARTMVIRRRPSGAAYEAAAVLSANVERMLGSAALVHGHLQIVDWPEAEPPGPSLTHDEAQAWDAWWDDSPGELLHAGSRGEGIPTPEKLMYLTLLIRELAEMTGARSTAA